MYREVRTEAQRSSLEVFILALVNKGLTTSYALQREAGLSLGATVPALKRLLDAGLVTKKEVGRRREFALTPDGQKSMWTWDASARLPTDLDDIVRTAFLASLVVRDKDLPAKMLRQAAKTRRRLAEQECEVAERLQPRVGIKFDLSAYQWARAMCGAARLTAEQAVLNKIAATVERKRKKILNT